MEVENIETKKSNKLLKFIKDPYFIVIVVNFVMNIIINIFINRFGLSIENGIIIGALVLVISVIYVIYATFDKTKTIAKKVIGVTMALVVGAFLGSLGQDFAKRSVLGIQKQYQVEFEQAIDQHVNKMTDQEAEKMLLDELNKITEQEAEGLSQEEVLNIVRERVGQNIQRKVKSIFDQTHKLYVPFTLATNQ